MNNSTGTKTERIYAALNTLDALTLEMRKITDHADSAAGQKAGWAARNKKAARVGGRN